MDDDCIDASRRELDDELRQLRSGASLALVSASLVHDFANLVTPILLLSARLGREAEEGSTTATLAAEIQAAASLAAALLRDILSLARPQGGALVDHVDVNSVVVERRRLLERLVGDGVEVVLDLAWDLGEVKVDRRRLEYALLNLVANARDAMPRGGRLTIVTRARGEGEPVPIVELVVADTGVGMSHDVLERAFDSFFTTKGESGGFGIGLASVQRFARESGGQVQLESEPERGTRVTVQLPRIVEAHERDSAALPSADPVAAASGSGRTALIADRDPRVRRAVQLALEGRGYVVLVATSCEEALATVAARTVHVALVDARLPCADRRTFLDRLHGSAPAVKVIVLTDAPTPREASPRDAKILPKAFSEDELLQAVREVLAP